ncbi:EF-hand calcium-binding domain-containing protein 11 [Rhizoclosmatium sp. JEL0117]|nr:EF-hand calcium-binding domain-containing protein 11 [Rhizoclosmatium sp. JEL0117]
MKSQILSNIRDAFQRADVEGRGYLSKHGLKVGMMGLLGYKPSKFEIEQINKRYNLERGELNLDAFTEIMAPRLAQVDSDDMIRQMFVALDLQGNGFITLENLKAVFRKVVPNVSMNVVEEFFAEVDTNRDGKVGYREFQQLINAAL